MFNKIKHKFLDLTSSEYGRNVTTIASGTIIAQCISIGSAPILYRIYSKEDYGTLGTYMSILGILGVFSTLRYNEAIIIEKDDLQAKQVLLLNRFINILFSILFFLPIILGGSLISKLLNNTNLNTWLYLIPVSIFFSGQNEIFKMWANRKKEYKLLTVNSIFTSLLVPVISISFGLFYNNALGLFLGLLISQIVPAIILHLRLSAKYNLSISGSINYNSLFEIAKKYQSFPFFSLPSDLINRLTLHLPVFVLSSNFGTSHVGVYNLCTRMLGLPIQLVSSSISTIFKEKAVHDYYKFGNCKGTFIYTAKSLLIIALFPSLIILFSGPYLFSLIFGHKWHDAGIYAQILAPMYFLNFIVSPLSYIYYVVNKQKEDFILHIIFFISSLLLFTLGGNLSIISLLINYSLLFSILYIIYFLRSLNFSNGSY